MEPKHIIAATALAGSLIILIISPDFSTAIAFTAACALFGFLQFLERKQIEKLEQIEGQLKALREQIEMLKLGRGMGR